MLGGNRRSPAWPSFWRRSPSTWPAMSFRTCSCRMPAPCRRQATDEFIVLRSPTSPIGLLTPHEFQAVAQWHADECVGAGAAPGAFVQRGIAVGEPLQGRVVEVERAGALRDGHGDGELETGEG